MEQRYIIVNLDKKEFVDPCSLDQGAQFWEIAVNRVSAVLPFLLRQCTGYAASMDIGDNHNHVGRWVGDRVVVVGEYDESGIYNLARMSPVWKDIGCDVFLELNAFIGVEDLQIRLIR